MGLHILHLLVNLIKLFMVAPIGQRVRLVYPARVNVWYSMDLKVLKNQRQRPRDMRHRLQVQKLLLQWLGVLLFDHRCQVEHWNL